MTSLPLRMFAGAAMLAGALCSSLAPAGAQTTRVRGTIDAIVGQTLDVATREGPMIALRISETTRLSAVVKATLADIKPGSYVGIAALPRPDGTQLALEVLIFPEAMRGAGEGHRPWDLLPESTMTNATVAETVQKVDGQALTLTYKDGSKTVVVPPEAPIVTFAPAERAELKPGTRVFANVTITNDGVNTVNNLVVGREGVDPPM